MPNSKRLTILNEAEVKDLYGIPSLSLEEKRVSFALNNLEQDVIKQVSPVARLNINLNGTYSSSFEQNLLDLDEIMQPIMQNEN
jgi:hypothetical protein